jgi:hypothetical protein
VHQLMVAPAGRDSLWSTTDTVAATALPDFGDVSLLSAVSEDDEAMRAFNAGAGRRFTAGALAKDEGDNVVAAAAAAAAATPLYEAVMDYTTVTTAGQDLHFRTGDRIRVTQEGQEGWWYV